MITFGSLVDKVSIMEGLGMSNKVELSLKYVVERIMQNEQFSTEELQEMSDLFHRLLRDRLAYTEHALRVCDENVGYVKLYLSGKMYQDQSELDQYAEIQLGNLERASDVINAGKGGIRFDRFKYDNIIEVRDVSNGY